MIVAICGIVAVQRCSAVRILVKADYDKNYFGQFKKNKICGTNLRDKGVGDKNVRGEWQRMAKGPSVFLEQKKKLIVHFRIFPILRAIFDNNFFFFCRTNLRDQGVGHQKVRGEG